MRGDLVFITGQTSRDRSGNVVGKGDIAAQTRQVLENIKGIMEAAGGNIDDVAKITIYLTDMSNIAKVTEVRKEYFTGIPPTSTSVQVERLANPDYLIEIEAVAVL